MRNIGCGRWIMCVECGVTFIGRSRSLDYAEHVLRCPLTLAELKLQLAATLDALDAPKTNRSHRN